jgi:hypothetical protein
MHKAWCVDCRKPWAPSDHPLPTEHQMVWIEDLDMRTVACYSLDHEQCWQDKFCLCWCHTDIEWVASAISLPPSNR